MRRTASEALQSDSSHRRGLQGLFGRARRSAGGRRQRLGVRERLETIDMGFRVRTAASGSDHAKPTSSVGNAIPSITTGAWSPAESRRATASPPRTTDPKPP